MSTTELLQTSHAPADGPVVTTVAPALRAPERTAPSRRGWPRVVRTAVLAAVAVSLATAAWWGLALSRTELGAVGEPVPLGGGTVTVQGVRSVADPMATMHRSTSGGLPAGARKDPTKATSDPNGDAFANMGMAGMAQQSADPVPKGRRRIRVDLLVTAGDLAVRLRPSDVVVVDDRGGRTTAHSSQLGDAEVAPGMTLAASAQFDVPARATGLQVQVRGAERPVAVDPGTRHGH